MARKMVTEPLAAGIGAVLGGIDFGSIFGFADGGYAKVADDFRRGGYIRQAVGI